MRRILLLVWLGALVAALYLFFFHRETIQDRLESATSASMLVGSLIFLLLGCIRGFTLIPSTSLVLLAVVFFPPVPLFLLTLAGIVVSSACIYYFAEALGLDELIRRRHAAGCDRCSRATNCRVRTSVSGRPCQVRRGGGLGGGSETGPDVA